eukprot:scaffold7328_cov314-Pinguiococcus_pyrenoidosus.AAC.92
MQTKTQDCALDPLPLQRDNNIKSHYQHQSGELKRRFHQSRRSRNNANASSLAFYGQRRPRRTNPEPPFPEPIE